MNKIIFFISMNNSVIFLFCLYMYLVSLNKLGKIQDIFDSVVWMLYKPNSSISN